MISGSEASVAGREFPTCNRPVRCPLHFRRALVILPVAAARGRSPARRLAARRGAERHAPHLPRPAGHAFALVRTVRDPPSHRSQTPRSRHAPKIEQPTQPLCRCRPGGARRVCPARAQSTMWTPWPHDATAAPTIPSAPSARSRHLLALGTGDPAACFLPP